MIRLRLATEAGIQEITPASLTHCAGCEQEYYLDGPADPDPHFCCEVYDRRTDRRRLPECIRATNPVSIELMREAAERNYRIDACSSWSAHEAYDVPFRIHEPRRPLIEFDPSAPIVHRTLRFHVTRCECDEHGQFTALLLRGEKPFCPFCIELGSGHAPRAVSHLRSGIGPPISAANGRNGGQRSATLGAYGAR